MNQENTEKLLAWKEKVDTGDAQGLRNFCVNAIQLLAYAELQFAKRFPEEYATYCEETGGPNGVSVGVVIERPTQSSVGV